MEYAEKFGKRLAEQVIAQFGNDPFQIAQQWGWEVVIAADDAENFPAARLAVWEGDRRRIRIFLRPLRRRFLDVRLGLRLVCGHELFHGLYAGGIRSLGHRTLNRQEQEKAAEVFAETLIHA